MVFTELSPLTHDVVYPPFSAVSCRSVASHPVPGNFLQQLKWALCDTAALPTITVCSMTLCVCVILRVGPHPYHFLLRSTVWIVCFLHNIFVPAAGWLRNSPNEKQLLLRPNSHWLLIPLPPGSSDVCFRPQHWCLPGSSLFTVPWVSLLRPLDFNFTFQAWHFGFNGAHGVSFLQGEAWQRNISYSWWLHSSFNFDTWIWLDLSSDLGGHAEEPRPAPQSPNSPGAVPLFLAPQPFLSGLVLKTPQALFFVPGILNFHKPMALLRAHILWCWVGALDVVTYFFLMYYRCTDIMLFIIFRLSSV